MNHHSFYFVFLSLFLISGLPAEEKKDSLNVLLFNGGRPWTAQAPAAFLKKAGIKVKVIDSKGLAGLGGASIKEFLTDKTEPVPQDMISPEFKRLSSYDAVIVCSMKNEDQKKFFTPGRVDALKEFLKNGGVLITAENVPSEIEEILPVTFSATTGNQKIKECRPAGSLFKDLPGNWPYMGNARRQVHLKTNAEALAAETDQNSNNASPYISAINYGKGKSIYWDAEWERKDCFRQLRDWAYFRTILPRLVFYGKNINNQADLHSDLRFKQPPVTPLEAVDIKITPPKMEGDYKVKIASCTENGDRIAIVFENGNIVEFNKKTLIYNIFYPGQELPVYQNIPMPEIIESMDDANKKLDMSTFEAAVVGKLSNKKHQMNFYYDGMKESDRKSVTIKIKGSDGFEGSLLFRAATLDINGRQYYGIGTKFSINTIKNNVEAIKINAPLRMGASVKNHYSWAMACYAPPRGFREARFSENSIATTNTWQHFGTGQPFNWIASPMGVVCEFLDRPFVNNASVSCAKSTFIQTSNELVSGISALPLEYPELWRFYSQHEPEGPNNWMAMYQYLRKRYCEKAGILRAPLYPESVHTNTCTTEERLKSYDAAVRLGFRIHKLPLCPSAIETLSTKELAEDYRLINSRGLEAKPWSAGAYTQGMDNPVAAGHPEWLVYGKDGKATQYFGCHPVFDINNPDYLKYYFSVLDKAASNGMKHIYLDMGGEQARIINYKGQDQKTQIHQAGEIFRFLRDKGLSVSIEGMNPLVMDEFWFRKDLYVNHTGKEFAFVGMSPSATLPDHLAMDYFRMAMYYAFIDVIVSPYACGMETVPDENRLMEEIGKINHVICPIIDKTGIPFVQETTFGTVWYGKDCAVLFFWNPVERLYLELPENWLVQESFSATGNKPEVTVNIIKKIPHKSIIFIQRNDSLLSFF